MNIYEFFEHTNRKSREEPKTLNSYDIVGKAILEYWDEHHQEDMVAFFYQKYEFESDKDWVFMSEIVLTDGQGNIHFLSDFCEGETCVKNLTIVPLDTVLEWYSESKHLGNAEWADNKCSNCGKGIEDLIYSREWYENEKPNYCPFCGTRFIMKG